MNRGTHRWLLLLLVCLAVVGMWRLRFDVEILNLLPRKLPEVEGLSLYNEHFANARELILSVQAEDPTRAGQAAQAIAEQLREDTGRVAEAHWQPPWREHPDQAAAMLAHTWINRPPEQFNQLVQQLNPDGLETRLHEARTRLTTTLSPEEFARLGFDPLGFTPLPGRSQAGTQFGRGDEMFASADGTFRLVFIQATSDLADYRECAAWFDAIQQQVREVQDSAAFPKGVTVRYTGRPAFVSEISGGMQSDMTRSVVGTGLIVAGLFWWTHRRFKPMGWLMLLMALAIGLTLAFGGLIYGPLNVISVGFAAILLGLAADYGMVLYQEWREQSIHGQVPQVGSARRGVRWSALTTASAFLMLNLSGLPGLSQLGTLVAIGVLIGATLMLRLYLAPFLRERGAAALVAEEAVASRSRYVDRLQSAGSPLLTAVLLVAILLVLWGGLPPLNRSADSLRPSSSPAYTALDEIEGRMQRSGLSLWLILSGKDEADVARALDRARDGLETAKAGGRIDRYTLPTEIWPRPANVASNRNAALRLMGSWPELRAQVLGAGFTTNALALADGVMVAFKEQVHTRNPWPDNDVARWSLGQFTARTPGQLLVMGLVYPTTGTDTRVMVLPDELTGRAWLVGWERLGQALADVVRRDLTRVLAPTLAIVVICLGLAFRRVADVLLSLAALGFSLATLCAVMKAAGWSWNLLNLMALPLLLGVGVDYTIHTVLALRRFDGDLTRTRRSVGRALFLCAATTATGFGSLALSNNAGLASLGKVCAAGVIVTYLAATVLLPGWWRTLVKKTPTPNTTAEQPRAGVSERGPSALYGARGWQVGLWIGRRLPYAVLRGLAGAGSWVYRKLARHRFDTVTANLRPICGDDAATEAASNRLFTKFSRKLADLWAYESGRPIEHMFGDLVGLEHLLAARASGRGLLLVTPHLGNWEFGAPLLTRQGVSMQVVTLAEPDKALTRLRQESRARWNIQTVVIGADPFGFVELIRRLEDGATVALLVDRPAAATATDVQLFGRPFRASSAPAELARATGCAILPVYVVREDGHYTATALAPVDYDRASLRDPAARHQLTQKIARAFEPAIRQHADQWYHFVPVWPETKKPQGPAADI